MVFICIPVIEAECFRGWRGKKAQRSILFSSLPSDTLKG